MVGPVEVLIWSAVALAAVVVLGLVVLAAKRFYVKSLHDGPQQQDFTLESLERLRDAGEISREEFARLRRARLGLPPENEKDESKSSSGAEVDD